MTEYQTGLFVRGKYQLARYEPGSGATGRRLTVHEVREAYGPHVFAEIDERLSAVLLAHEGAIEQALQKQRDELGVTLGQFASAANVDPEIVARAEKDADQIDLRLLEHLAFVLGLDPAKLSVDERAGSDPNLGVKLRVLQESDTAPQVASLTPRAVLRFSEAASIIRSQLSLQRWLNMPEEAIQFEASDDYGPPAWSTGYALAKQAREHLGMGLEPVKSMRDLVERRLGIPVIQVELPLAIAGATVSSHGRRGIVLNVAGANSDVWIRRATLAHELAHILFDPDEKLSNVRVDRYDEVACDAEQPTLSIDEVEQRANAFAVEFLAPTEAVKSLVPSPAQLNATDIKNVMSRFGIGLAAALFHVGNAWKRKTELPPESAISAVPTDEQREVESLTLNHFQPENVPEQRRGRFALLTAEAVDAGLITLDTGGQYLACSEDELSAAQPFLREIRRSQQIPSPSDWAGPSDSIGTYIVAESNGTLKAYSSQPNLVDEHANQEEDTARGGYAHRQLLELVQNGADALAGSGGGRIWVELTSTHLYCADEGRAIDPAGVTALMFSHLSSKRGIAEIGRFGLGFKSVLGVTDAPEFFSRSGSFRFDRERAASLILPIAPDAGRYPVLRLPEAIDPRPEMMTDPILRSLMGWAVNIVRLPLKQGAYEALHRQIKEFPPEFLIFVKHVSQLKLQTDDQEVTRTIGLSRENSHLTLDDGGKETRWMLVSDTHALSADAKSDSRSLDDATEIPISWAAPIDRLNEPGKFWAFFPTQTTSLLSGILNAPWKTNEDRQNLLLGVYNEELIDTAASMVARALPELSTIEDPARHLDALPRRLEAGDSEHSRHLRDRLNSNLQDRDIVPDQDGKLRKMSDILYPPRELTRDGQVAWDSLDLWAAYAGRPSGWLHHATLNRNRLATLERVSGKSLSREAVSDWLRALVKNATEEADAIQASKAAIQTAAAIPESIRGNHGHLGDIVLTDNWKFVTPNPDVVFLGGDDSSTATNMVHPLLQADIETLNALRKLGIKPASAESMFSETASILLRRPRHEHGVTRGDEWHNFWRLSRNIDNETAVKIIGESIYRWDNWRDKLCVRTRSGNWRSLFQTLLPGPIVSGDGKRDTDIAIDVDYHYADLPLLSQMGATDSPRVGHELSHTMSWQFTNRCTKAFQEHAKNDIGRRPQDGLLVFERPETSGPLDLLELLSEEGKAKYTWDLLSLDDTFRQWTMRHKTQDIYPSMDFESPALENLRQHGRIETNDGIYPLSAGLGDPPQSRAALFKLLSHPKAALIRQAFELQGDIDLPTEPIDVDDPVPLADIWPGLRNYLSKEWANFDLIRCDGFRRLDGIDGHDERDCIIKDSAVYVTRKSDERDELITILRTLGLQLDREHFERILLGLTNAEVRAARERVRECTTDEERLLAAIGESNLKRRLPGSLIAILEQTQGPLTGIRAAQAAISTFHSGALREYRDALVHLDPPRHWAGSQRAVEFVRSLGFVEEWAGERNPRRDPYIEVEGPYSLPELHDYQRKVVGNVRKLIHSNGTAGERRGMISMPTGSGKTRVAVQSIVEAIREDGFKGGILWVADRDELCEQAVEAWRQVWASEGTQATQLRISRMWAGQPQPLPTGDMHVIVATIQTLAAKISRQPDSYKFLADFKLLVFDEAHRSVAPTFTSVMQELGLTRWRRSEEPFLVGLTATPYRGYDEVETQRLVNRYGSNRLDSGAFPSDDPENVIQELQEMRVLARADHGTIEGGRFSLSSDELQQAGDFPWLPRSVEDRIARDTDRTKRIIQAYRDRVDPEWPTLIFATSIEHSQTIAALLTSIGVKARAVSGSTETSVRRRVVEEFRSSEVKALVNYGVFREGFDAPKTRAIIVARPVYSPNLYFQMIGRGLRGIKNGGNDRCLILNVRDNIDNFERRLAFSDLDGLWA